MRFCHYPFLKLSWIFGIVPAIPRPAKVPSDITFEVVFNRAAYDHHGPDNEDWNKGKGYSFDVLKNRVESFMWVWRWDQEAGKVENSGYVHSGGSIFKEDYDTFLVNEGERFRVRIRLLEGSVEYTFQTLSLEHKVFLAHHFDLSDTSGKTINPWFGGNKSPKRVLCVQITEVSGLFF